MNRRSHLPNRTAFDYMTRVLENGHTLAKFLVRVIAPNEGIFFALSPRPLTRSQVLRFDSGHFPQRPVSAMVGGVPGAISPVANSQDELMKVLHKLLEPPEAVCFLENSLASGSDTWLRKAKSRVISHGAEVYHVLFSDDRAEAKISAAIREAQQIPIFVGAVGHLAPPVASSIMKRRTVATGDLEEFAATARCIFIGAYDGEGYVVWSRDSV